MLLEFAGGAMQQNDTAKALTRMETGETGGWKNADPLCRPPGTGRGHTGTGHGRAGGRRTRPCVSMAACGSFSSVAGIERAR